MFLLLPEVLLLLDALVPLLLEEPAEVLVPTLLEEEFLPAVPPTLVAEELLLLPEEALVMPLPELDLPPDEVTDEGLLPPDVILDVLFLLLRVVLLRLP